jgi:hypothetical protein
VATAPPLPTQPPNPPPSNFQTSPNLVTFDPKSVVPSQTLYLQRNDYLGFNILTNLTSASVRINYRWLAPNGEIKEGELDTPVFSGNNFQSVPLYEGWLLSFGARVVGGGGTGSWCFLQAMVFRSATAGAATNPHSLFWQGFIGTNASNGWPGTPAKEITDGPGTLILIAGATPGLGAEISEIVPSQRRRTLLSFRARLTTSATVANRFPSFLISDGVNTAYRVGTNVAQAASIADAYCLSPGASFYNDTNTNFLIPAPTLIQLRTSLRILTSTVGIQAGDQWDQVQYLVLEWGAWDT